MLVDIRYVNNALCPPTSHASKYTGKLVPYISQPVSDIAFAFMAVIASSQFISSIINGHFIILIIIAIANISNIITFLIVSLLFNITLFLYINIKTFYFSNFIPIFYNIFSYIFWCLPVSFIIIFQY